LEQESQAVDRVQLDNATAAALILKIGRGDPSALETLYNMTSRLVFGLIVRILGDRTAAEAVLLDVYTHVWKHSTSYNPKGLMPLEWLITIARSRAVFELHWSRQSGRKTEVAINELDSTITVSPEWQNLARTSIESLVPAQREVLEWAYYTGLSCSEVAAQIGKPLGAVKIHARLGMSKLSELFRPLYERET
jgi:RNA polymerase sigma-70 factor, ECF subfamily